MRKRTLCLLLCLALALLSAQGLAHSGRTDANGGHKDNQNKSGLGPYHYHCGGHPAHLHENGVCPYGAKTGATKAPAVSPKATAAPKPTATPKPTAGKETDSDLRYGKTNVKGVNVRAKASADAKKVHAFPRTGTAFEVLDEITDKKGEAWYRIRYGGGEGFVKAEFVDLIEREEYEQFRDAA